MVVLKNALVIGGGIGGMCTAIELRKRGIEVELVELDPGWQVYGAGITISGPTLRAFKHIGVIDRIMAEGWCADGCDLANAAGEVFAQLPTPRIAGPEVPGGGGIMRPVLARILREATLQAGVRVRLGCTFTTMEECDDATHVEFSDGSTGRYDLVVGADGVQSKVREHLFPGLASPRFTGQGCWRAVIPRPPEIVRATMYMGERAKAGINPVSKEEMYLFFLDQRERPEYIAPESWAGILREELGEFSGLIGQIRDSITPESRILYRPLAATMLPRPWHRGRVVMIGDAVHATTPHLASGAGIAVEDAVVLAQEIDAGGYLQQVLTRFTERRFERCRVVVDSSVRLGEIEQHGGSKDEHAGLMRTAMATLLAPI